MQRQCFNTSPTPPSHLRYNWGPTPYVVLIDSATGNITHTHTFCSPYMYMLSYMHTISLSIVAVLNASLLNSTPPGSLQGWGGWGERSRLLELELFHRRTPHPTVSNHRAIASSITKIHPEILPAIVPVFFLVAIVSHDYWTFCGVGSGLFVFASPPDGHRALP